jgi:hypothetical protein
MAVINVRSREGKTWIGLESSFGASGAATPIFPIGPVKLALKQEEIPIKDQSVFRGDHKGTVKGRKSATAAFEIYAKPAAQQLVALATPATPPHAILTKATLGGEHAAAGSLVAVGTSSSSIDVTGSTGANFPVGTVIAVEVNGSLEATRVISQATDTLGLYPRLSAAPSVGAKVINSYTYYQTETNTQSVFLRHEKAGSTSFQWELNGGIASLDFKTDRDTLISIGANMQFADWQDGALGADNTFAADTQHAPVPLVSGFTLLQTPGTTTRTQYPFQSVQGKIEASMQLIPQLAGPVQQTLGTFRGSADQTATVELMIAGADRTLLDTWWASQSSLFLMFGALAGSGNTARGIVFTFPQAILISRPQEDESTGRLLYKCSLAAQLDPTASTELARAGVLVSHL